jgi:hypothetical protein
MAQKFAIGKVVQLSDRASASLKNSYGVNGLVYIAQFDGTSNPYGLRPLDKDGNEDKNGVFNWARTYELQEVIVKKSSRERMTEQVEKHQAEIAAIETKIENIKSKLEYMDEIKSDEYDDNEFKAYQAITIISRPGMSKLDQAKALAVLIAGK